MYSLDDTIVAIASAPGGAARGIARLSGPEAIHCLDRLLSTPGQRGMSLVTTETTRVIAAELSLPGLASKLPCDIYLWSERSGVARSYTGQAVVEIHTVGSAPLMELILRTLCEQGARLAGPGEFTMRAFLAGRIDLTQAEAVLGVIDAVDREDLSVALGQLAGGLGRPLHQLRDGLLELLAHIEAGFDFADEQLPFITAQELVRRLVKVERQIETIQRQMVERVEHSQTVTAVLLGRPNTGKSSLFNALVDDRTAIVSDRPGTTRDYLAAELDLGGVKCRLVDTAGCLPVDAGGRITDSTEIETVSQTVTVEQRRAAQVTVLCLDSTRSLDAWERELLNEVDPQRTVVVATKCDDTSKLNDLGPVVPTSAVTGAGLDVLRSELREKCLANTKHEGGTVAGTARRCRESIRLAAASVARARESGHAGQEELVAAELRVALDELGKVVGAVYTEDVLDRIFSRFCVGK